MASPICKLKLWLSASGLFKALLDLHLSEIFGFLDVYGKVKITFKQLPIIYVIIVKPYEKMTLSQLEEAEDEFDEEDMKAIETYRYSDLFCLRIFE